MKVFVTSFFDYNRESNVLYNSQINVDQVYTYEMYNKTQIFVYPDSPYGSDPFNQAALTFSFVVNTTALYKTDQISRFERIPVYISGYGALLLTLAVLIYLEAF